MSDTTIKLSSGFDIPLVGVGTAKSPKGAVAKAIETALKVGYRHIDGAYLYNNEDEVGEGLKSAIDKGYVTRDDVFITGKLWIMCYRKDLVRECLATSLKNLGVDYIDLYLLHWPFTLRQGLPDTIVDAVQGSLSMSFLPKDEQGEIQLEEVSYMEAWRVLEDCVREGLIRSIGLSNFNSIQVQDVLDKAEIKPVMNQIECHPYLNQEKLVKFCTDRNIAVTAYCPLGGPVGNSGPFNKPIPRLHEDTDILELAKKYGKTAAQIALRFNVQRSIVVVPRSCNEGRLQQNLDVFDFELSEDDMKAIYAKNSNQRTCPAHIFKDAPQYPFNIPF